MRAEGQIARGGDERESTVGGTPSESLSEQYSLAKILSLWAVLALPMGLLAWVIARRSSFTSRFTPVVVPEGRLTR